MYTRDQYVAGLKPLLRLPVGRLSLFVDRSLRCPMTDLVRFVWNLAAYPLFIENHMNSGKVTFGIRFFRIVESLIKTIPRYLNTYYRRTDNE